MSPSDWSWQDLDLFSTQCTRISEYSDHLEPHLQGLLDKYQDLGQKLYHLSQRLKNSSTRYYDPALDKHLQKVKKEFQDQRTTNSNLKPGLVGRVRTLGRRFELTTEKIKQLHFDVDKHIELAEKFRTESLFNYAYPKLEYIFQKFVEQVSTDNRKAGKTDTISANPMGHEVTNHNTPPISSALLSIGDRDARTLANAPVAIKIARIVWKNRAEALDQDRNRPRRSEHTRPEPAIAHKDAIIVAKEKYLSDVLSLIEETQLDELCASSEGPSRDFLDRLASIVSQAAKLDDLPLSLGPDTNQNKSDPSCPHTPPGDAATPPGTEFRSEDGRSQLPTPPRTGNSLAPSQMNGKAHSIPRKPVPQHSHPLSPPISGAIASVDDAPGSSVYGGSSQVNGHSGPLIEPSFTSLGPPAISSSGSESSSRRGDTMDVSSMHPSAVVLSKRPARPQDASQDRSKFPPSWTQISCLEAGLMQSLCTLRIDSFDDKYFLLAVVTANLSPALITHGYNGNVLENSLPTFHMDRMRRKSSLSHGKTYEHLILPDARPMASVLHPEYEGLAHNPGRPYTLSFKERQSLCEYTVNLRPQLVSDLEYIFSDKTERNLIRSYLFGKQLRLHAGVESIKFDYIACLKGAVSLWEECTSKPLTISFDRKSKKSKDRPDGEVEYELVTLTSRGKGLKDPLTLTVRQVAGPGSRELASKTKECRLYFSRRDEKAAFLSILEPPQHRPGR